ncbi:sensor histidine kinase [soil metagenome]
MTARRWWVLAVSAAALLSGVVLALSIGFGTRFWVGAAILVAFTIFWAVVARPDSEGTPRSVVVLVVTIVTAGALTATDSSLAFFQTIAYPAVWTLLVSVRNSIIASVGVAVAETVGFLLPLKGYSTLPVVALTIEGISLVFAIVMGVWITRIAQLGQERKRLFDELTATQDELGMLHRDAGVTSERERLARELHDTIAQSLTGLVLLGQRSRRELAAGTLSDGTLELIESGAREALAEARSLVADGAPVELDAGISAALTRLGERFERETGVTVSTSSHVDGDLDRDIEVVLLRCAQEGLANVRKHAKATHAQVELTVDGATATATVRIVDDGHGFDPASASSGFGLSGLRDRLALVGGDLAVDGTAGATTVTARLPLAASA